MTISNPERIHLALLQECKEKKESQNLLRKYTDTKNRNYLNSFLMKGKKVLPLKNRIKCLNEAMNEQPTKWWLLDENKPEDAVKISYYQTHLEKCYLISNNKFLTAIKNSLSEERLAKILNGEEFSIASVEEKRADFQKASNYAMAKYFRTTASQDTTTLER